MENKYEELLIQLSELLCEKGTEEVIEKLNKEIDAL